MPTNVLILGGTADANGLASRLSGDPRYAVTLSLAGRTLAPRVLPVATRVGGFGGAHGLSAYLNDNAIDVLIDATHPFAERISANAALAARQTGLPLLTFGREPWRPVTGDAWTEVADLAAAAAALPEHPARVFLTVGRQSLAPFAAKPQHHYVIRVIDAPDIPTALTDTLIVVGRGPFTEGAEIELIHKHRIDLLVTKNSGGEAASAKLAAARALKLPVILVRQPAPAGGHVLHTPDAVLGALARFHGDLAKRSV